MNIITRKKYDIKVDNINTKHILKILHMITNINSHASYDTLNIVLLSINLKNGAYFPQSFIFASHKYEYSGECINIQEVNIKVQHSHRQIVLSSRIKLKY